MDASKDWKETVPPGEAERFEQHARTLAAIQKGRNPRLRGLHAKQRAGVRAQLEVLDVPEHLRVAIFSAPKKYEAYVRFSNGNGVLAADDKRDLRGLAIKILGVPGKKLIPGLEDETTQDFLFINAAAFPFRSVEEFVVFLQATTSELLLPFRLFRYFGLGTFAFLKRLRSLLKAIPSFATETYFSVASIRFGDYAARLSLVPAQRANGAPPSKDLRAEMEQRLRNGAVSWELRAQLFVNEARTPIEDTSVAWSESDSPPIVLARLTIPQQEPDPKTFELVESLAFDPWHAAVELRPLGAAMRARNPAYRESQKLRGAAKEPR